MATTKFYLDTRAAKNGQPAPLKISITQKRKTALINLNISIAPEQWDKNAEKIINHPQKQVLNNFITGKKWAVDCLVLKMMESGEVNRLDAGEVKKRILSELNPENEKNEKSFAARFLRFAELHKKSTKGVYMQTYKRMAAYVGEEKLKSIAFEDVTKDWLMGFDLFMQKTAPSKNARNIHLRNIRAVFNDAIDDEVTAHYPFRRFKIRPVATPKRSLTVERLRMLFDAPTEEHAAKYLDMFKLIFFLIGINVVDLCNLKEVRDGRIEYYRAKTNRLYSIKVEPEAQEIIDRYRGEKQLLYMLDRYADHNDYTRKINLNLKRIGGMERKGKGGKKCYDPMFPQITTYWARHSWATIAASLDIPKETIAAALGHGGNTVTDIYIDFDRNKIDEANRRVMDWVLYGKR